MLVGALLIILIFSVHTTILHKRNGSNVLGWQMSVCICLINVHTTYVCFVCLCLFIVLLLPWLYDFVQQMVPNCPIWIVIHQWKWNKILGIFSVSIPSIHLMTFDNFPIQYPGPVFQATCREWCRMAPPMDSWHNPTLSKCHENRVNKRILSKQNVITRTTETITIIETKTKTNSKPG